jgi:hypothetical protein
MEHLIVRPIMAGLLAIIIAGLWTGPLARGEAGLFAHNTSCRAGTTESQSPVLIGAMIRRGAHC